MRRYFSAGVPSLRQPVLPSVSALDIALGAIGYLLISLTVERDVDRKARPRVVPHQLKAGSRLARSLHERAGRGDGTLLPSGMLQPAVVPVTHPTLESVRLFRSSPFGGVLITPSEWRP